MEQKIIKISKYLDKDLQEYFNKEKLDVLHTMKIYSDDLYYNTGKADVFKDYQYDMLKDILAKRDPDYVVPIGARIREGENRVKLPYWLGSIDKVKSEDISKWIGKQSGPPSEVSPHRSFIVEDKLDGVSCLAIIKKGKIKLYTRGDGIVGADISYLAQYFDTIPKNLKKVDINVRGELIMPVKTFAEKYAGEYANPRNMVAGRIGAKEIRPGLSDIKFIAYEIVGPGVMEAPSRQLASLDSLGFTTVHREIMPKFNDKTLAEMLIKFKSVSDFEIDGIIVQPDAPYERNISGNPEYAFAFKMRFEDNLKETTVVEVHWNISKWGLIKPTVELVPIKLGGVTITNTSGFNAKYIVDNKIGPGAVIVMTRSGDVIPYITRVIKPAPDGADLPEEIPFKWNETGVDIYTEEFGATMCIKLIAGFFAKLGIKQIAEQRVENMYDDGLDTLLKIIAASEERIAQVPGYGKQGAKVAYTNIHKNLQDLSIPVVLGASGVFGMGMGRKRVTALFESMPDILSEYKTISKNQLYVRIMQIEGFSDKTTIQIVDNIVWADKFIKALGNYATFKKKMIVSDDMKDMRIVFTGFRDAKLEEQVIARGGKVSSGGVSKTTTLLVVPTNMTTESKKVLDARKLGIEILDKDDFIQLYMV